MLPDFPRKTFPARGETAPSARRDPAAALTLTTDFGLDSAYVAQVKGVLLGLARGNPPPLVDVSHSLPQGDTLRAGMLLLQLTGAFPAGSLHLAVVDPGVGTERAILAVDCCQQFFVAPDNGLLDPLFSFRSPRSVVRVETARFRRPAVSPVFHGRDIFAPVAWHLFCDGSLESLGKPYAVTYRDLQPVRKGNRILGCILLVDGFGNLITNIPAEQLLPGKPRIRLENGPPLPLVTHYAAGPASGLALPGSHGFLELALPNASAARSWNCGVGDRVSVEF